MESVGMTRVVEDFLKDPENLKIFKTPYGTMSPETPLIQLKNTILSAEDPAEAQAGAVGLIKGLYKLMNEASAAGQQDTIDKVQTVLQSDFFDLAGEMFKKLNQELADATENARLKPLIQSYQVFFEPAKRALQEILDANDERKYM